MNNDKATLIMLAVHNKGKGVCGIYPRDIASTKVSQVISLARKNQHPLQCLMEEINFMIAQELEVTLHMAFMDARQRKHEFVTVEHLLLALLDNPSASEIFKACDIDVTDLRKILLEFVEEHTPQIKSKDIDTQPTLGFQRVIQRAILRSIFR